MRSRPRIATLVCMESETYDVAIIGGGPAGLSAALVLGRARRRVVVIDAGAPRNAAAAHMQGFLSRDGMPPADLLQAARAEVQRYGVELVEGSSRRHVGTGGRSYARCATRGLSTTRRNRGTGRSATGTGPT